MADKITSKIQNCKGGLGIDSWMQVNVLSNASFHQGPTIKCFNLLNQPCNFPTNQVGILFENCSFKRVGTNDNFGFGGSNCVSGNPVCFVDIETVYPQVFQNQCDNDLLRQYQKPLFVLPIALIGEYPDLTNFMLDSYAAFVALHYGDIIHNDTHIANGLACGMAAICFALCKEITLNGETPNITRVAFLIEALQVLTVTCQSVAKKSLACKKIFELLPMMAKTADTFQSILFGFIFDIIPSREICVNLIASSIRRHFRYQKHESFLQDPPIGLIGLLLIAPWVVSKGSSTSTINEIINTLNNVITKIVQSPKLDDVHSQNIFILTCFAKASPICIIEPNLIPCIYDAVLNYKHDDIAKLLNLSITPSFIKFVDNLTLFGHKCFNFPILVQDYSFIPADPREWTGIRLESNGTYEFKAETLGISTFKKGNTQGEEHVANFRFTAGNELIKGRYDGYASSGIFYNAKDKKFQAMKYDADVNLSFEINIDPKRIQITQKNKTFLHIPNVNHVLLCFKNCQITILQKKDVIQSCHLVKSFRDLSKRLY